MAASRPPSRSFPRGTAPFAPILAACAGIATFSAMDAAIKGAALVVGVYTALLLRNLIGTAMVLPVWLAGSRRRPPVPVLRLHVLRSVVNTGMALLFFVGIVRLPMAEGIAISFISPLIALYLASVMLKERIRRQAILASLLGLAGVSVIVADRLGTAQASGEALVGIAAVLASAVLYAINLVLQRKLALLAGAVEVTLFQNAITAFVLALFAPWFAREPDATSLGLIAIGAALATLALGLLAWAYARAEAQVLMPVEYTAFLWAAVMGWVFFSEPLGWAALAGTVLIVLGCWLGTRGARADHIEQTAL